MGDIRIDIESEGPVSIVHVAGRLAGLAIIQLTNVCEPMEDNFVLNLSNLTFADDTGVEVIRTLREKGADIRGHHCSSSFSLTLTVNLDLETSNFGVSLVQSELICHSS